MRKLIMKMSISVDGFVSSVDNTSDWIFKTADEESRAWSLGLLQNASLIIMGRKSYEGWATFWPTMTGPFAKPMNETPKAVFTQKGFKIPASISSSPNAGSWADPKIFDGDLVESITKLKKEPGNHISVAGGAGFVRSLIAENLIDVYHLATHPILLGDGLRMFPNLAKPADLKLADTKVFSGGIVVHTYAPLSNP